MKILRLAKLLTIAISLLWGNVVFAAAFYLSEFGTPSSVGTAGVGSTVNTDGADAAWTNPAGMTGISEDTMINGLMVIAPKVEFDSRVATAGGSDGGNAGEAAPVPSFFYTRVLSDKSRFGLSFVAVGAGGVDYGDNFTGRYSIQNVEMANIGITPSFAYKVNDRLSLGVGVSIIQTTLEQELAINTPGADGQAKFEDLDDWGYQGIFGLTYKLTTDTLLGVVYRSEADVELEGDLKIKGLPVDLPKQSVELDWTNPQWLEVGLRHQLDDEKTLMFNIGWQDWSEFSQNKVTVDALGVTDTVDRKWDDTYHAGAAYVQRPDPESFYTLGISYESSPVKDKYRTFDFPVDEMWKLSSSYGWKGKNKLDYSIGATLYLIGDAPIDSTDQGVRVSGKYDQNTMLFLSGTLKYVF
ncbi:MAG: outer membrane protein transport protein [Halopseudomonas aestusnigri]